MIASHRDSARGRARGWLRAIAALDAGAHSLRIPQPRSPKVSQLAAAGMAERWPCRSDGRMAPPTGFGFSRGSLPAFMVPLISVDGFHAGRCGC